MKGILKLKQLTCKNGKRKFPILNTFKIRK
jgi:hypothetical protein